MPHRVTSHKPKNKPTSSVSSQLQTDALAHQRQKNKKQKDEQQAAQWLKTQQKMIGKKTTEEYATIRIIHRQDDTTRKRSLHQNGKHGFQDGEKGNSQHLNVSDPSDHARLQRPLSSARDHMECHRTPDFHSTKTRPQSAKPVLQTTQSDESLATTSSVSGKKISVRRWENWLYSPNPLTTSTQSMPRLQLLNEMEAVVAKKRTIVTKKAQQKQQDLPVNKPFHPQTRKQHIVVYLRRLELENDDADENDELIPLIPTTDSAFQRNRKTVRTWRLVLPRHHTCPPLDVIDTRTTEAQEHLQPLANFLHHLYLLIMTEEASSTTTRRIATLTRHLQVTPLAVSTKAQVMAELQQERAHATFPTRQMTHFIDGGAHKTQYREDMMGYLNEFTEFHANAGSYDLSLAARREQTLNKVRRLYQLFIEHGANIEKRNIMAELIGIYDLGVWVRNGVHFGLFLGAIMSQGDKKQQDEWLAPSMMLEMFGSFGMTELGHGSFTRGFETTATFDRATDEFVIHTPTDTATKWWIGAAGETATHTVCFAQLVIDGEKKGVQSFIVPLRDPQTHAPLPGIKIGDCGTKMGLQGVDNGWIQFDQVRVPRFNMLRRYAHVTPEGKFIQTHKAQMAYAALIGTRGKLVTLSIGILKKALTIAIRYCAIRRQGEQVNSADPHQETKLLDYQSHQYRLLPHLAKAYAYHFQTSYIEDLIEKFEQEGGDLSMDLLADIHGTMAGLKAFSSWDSIAAIEECRQSCGGNGYSAYTGLSSILADFSVIVTFEGDNTVMAQQTANYLIRSVETMSKGQNLAGSVQYLEKVSKGITPKQWGVQSDSDLANAQFLVDALEFFAGTMVLQIAHKLNAQGNVQDAWNHCQVDLIECARVHVFYNVALRFIQQVEEIKTSSQHASLVPVLSALCQLYVLNEFDRSAGFFLREQFMTSQQATLVRQRVLDMCGRIRVDAVPLVDAFNLSDLVLNSTIGTADGNIYENMLNVVTKKTGVSPYFESAIKPMLEGEQLE